MVMVKRSAPQAAARGTLEKALLLVLMAAVACQIDVANADSLKTVRFAGSYDSIADIPVLVGISKGFFRKRGIDVEVEPVVGGTARLEALKEGRADFSNVDSYSALEGMSEGNRSFSILVSMSRNGDGRGCWARPGLEPAPGLAKRRIAVGPVGQIELAWALTQQGQTVRDIDMPVIASLDLPQALDDKRIDIACAGLETFERLRQQISSGSQVSGGTAGGAPASDQLIVIARKPLADGSEVTAQIADAVRESVNYTRSNPALSAATVANYFKDSPRAVLTELKSIELYDKRDQQTDSIQERLAAIYSLLRKAAFLSGDLEIRQWVGTAASGH